MTPKEVALALKDFINLRLLDNPFPLENILIHINNELKIDDKFCTTREVGAFADSIISAIPFQGANSEERLKAIQKMLNQFMILFESNPITDKEFLNLEAYYKKVNINFTFTKVTAKEIKGQEDKQWLFIRDRYLNLAKEQIIFNYKPAEIGDDNDPRTKKLRRDLIRNLGLVTGTNYLSKDDLSNNRDIICNYTFVVPSFFKAELIWIGILKELVRTVYELSNSIQGLETTKSEIFDLSLKKLQNLCISKYNVKAKTFFEICNISVPDLNPLNIFVTSDVYCWAPTVVLTTSSKEKDHKGFIIFQDKDSGVAEMPEETIILWRETILKKLSNLDECKVNKFSESFLKKNKTEILQVIKSF